MDTLDPGQGKLVQLRASAALLAASAWDVAPLELPCADASALTIFATYTRGGAAGAFDFQIWISPYAVAALVPAGAQEWLSLSQYAGAVLVAGIDSTSLVQRELFTYTATGAAAEAFVYGPLELFGTVERVRVACRESGNAGAPGTVQLQGVLR